MGKAAAPLTRDSPQIRFELWKDDIGGDSSPADFVLNCDGITKFQFYKSGSNIFRCKFP